MPITRITRLRDCGVFRDFRWPTDLPEFARYNLIYGWNGSGKTILSRIFRALENRAEPLDGQVTVTVEARDVSNGNFAQVTLPVRVFNRDFVADSVFPTEDGGVAPIFVVGKENVEKQKQVLKLKETLSGEQTKLARKREKNEGASKALDKFCIDKAKVIKDRLRSSGSNPYNDYNKGGFTRRMNAMISAGDKDAHAHSDPARDKLLTQIRSSPKSKLEPLTYRLPDLKALEKTVADLLSTTVVSAAIQALKDDATLSSWVRTGLGLHQERDGAKCLFCDQPMPKNRLATLEAHFSSAYEDLLRKLSEQITTIKAQSKTAKELAVPKAVEFYDDLSSESESAAAALRAERDSATRVLEELVRAMEDKKGRAFEGVALEVSVRDLKVGVIDSMNRVIEKHNQACDKFQTRIELARKQLEADSVATALDEFVKLQGAVQTAEREVTEANDEKQRLSGQIMKLEREIVEHRQPSEDLNEDLRNYLGHGEIRLEVKDVEKDPGYTIMRHDTPAESLSEGEMTAIALLYFLKSLNDRRFDLAHGVVVLDDPVSSLDANNLYSAFGFIRHRTQNAAQLVILTHNFTFFRQVRNWFDHLNKQNKKNRVARFYMLSCTLEQKQRCSHIRSLDPMLEKYDSEYHYLFAYVYRTAMADAQTSLEKNYVHPNVARRLLESFLAFRQPQISGGLWTKLKLVSFDETKKTRIIRFLHTYSHSSGIGEPEHDLSLLSESHAILNDLLQLMRSEDEKHYSAMEELVKPAAPDAEEGDE